jgi:hypothetical protein
LDGKCRETGTTGNKGNVEEKNIYIERRYRKTTGIVPVITGFTWKKKLHSNLIYNYQSVIYSD